MDVEKRVGQAVFVLDSTTALAVAYLCASVRE